MLGGQSPEQVVSAGWGLLSMMLRGERTLGMNCYQGGVNRFIRATSVGEVNDISINFIEQEGNATAVWQGRCWFLLLGGVPVGSKTVQGDYVTHWEVEPWTWWESRRSRGYDPTLLIVL